MRNFSLAHVCFAPPFDLTVALLLLGRAIRPRPGMSSSGLAGARSGSARASSRDYTIRAFLRPRSRGTMLRRRVWQREVLHRDQGVASGVPPRPPTLRLLLIRGEVEGDEEQEIAGQDGHARECGELLARALAAGRRPGEVGGGEVGVGREVDEAEVDDELDDLEDGDVPLPPDADATRGLEVVPVHHHVHCQVEGYGHPGYRGVADQLRVAEQRGGAMVVGV